MRRQSKKNARIGSSARSLSTSSLRPNRRIVIWNGCGRPFASNAIASPSRMRSWAGNASTASTISGIAAPTSLRLRVKMRTTSPERCAWMRAPSIFHSNAASPPSWRSASAGSAAVCASMGAIGERISSSNFARPASPSSNAARATAPTLFAYIIARRTGVTGSSAAAAIASVITPTSAPWRSSPASSRTRKSCSGSVASANSARNASARSAPAPAPRMTAISPRRRSTSAIESVGSRADSMPPASRSTA